MPFPVMIKSSKRKRLILFRHAKSSWSEGLEDHERPLADRGRRAAPVIGHYLAKARLQPDLVLVSTARRAQETWSRALRAMKGPIEARNTKEIYAASAERLLDVIHGVDASVGTLMLVGHNPGLEELSRMLMKDLGGDPGKRMREKYPTAAIAVLSFDVESWADVAVESGSLDRFVTPKSIG
jgi:phosphohistidine phosphatase